MSAGDLITALNAYNKARQGTATGYAGSAVNTGKLAGSLTGNNSLKGYSTDAGNLLGIYSGLKTGGWQGDTQAALNGTQLASNLGMIGPQFGQMAGYAAIPLSIYNEVNNWQSGATGADALGGASSGAAIGTMIMPGIGTAIGALGGAAAGALSSVFGNGRVDPENASFEGYTQAYNKATDPAQRAQIAAADQDPYLALAGYFDLRPNQLKGDNPIYSTYGRMGEQQFTNDLASHINSAISSGAVKPGASAQDIYNQAVAPWVSGMGAWNDSNKDAMTSLLQQMTSQYVGGQAASDWKSIGGQTPFNKIYDNSPLAAYQGASANQAATQAMQQQIPADFFKTDNQGGQTTKLARGGNVRRKTHFDDGGTTTYFGDDSGGYTDPGTTYYGDTSSDLPDWADPGINPYYSGSLPSGGSSSSGSGSGSGGGGNTLSQFLQGLGISGSTANSLSPYLAAVPALASLFAPKQGGKAPALPSQYSGTPLNMGTPSFTRAQNNLSGMSMNDWLHAGEGPEIQYYQNNALPATANSAPNQQIAQAISAATGQPFAGGYQNKPIQGGNPTVGGVAAPAAPPPQQAAPNYGIQPVTRNPIQPLAVMAAGGPYDDPHGAYGATSAIGHVRGPGDGTSDSIKLRNAYLSNGEYVVDAPTVSMLGNGSNDAGADWLDGFREHVRKSAGKHMAKGKQPMNTKGAASAYAYGGVAR